MARKRRNNKRGGNSTAMRGNLGGGITRVAFHRMAVNTLSGVTGNVTALLSPQTSSIGALDEIGDQFDLFRCVELEYRIHPMDPADSDQQAMAFIPDVDVQTTTAPQLSELPLAAVQSRFCGVPSSWVHVPRSQLKGMLDWYKCTADAGAAEFESQGILLLAGGLSDVMTWEVRGIMEFKNPVSEVVMMEHIMARLEKQGRIIRVPESGLPQGPAAPTAKPREGVPRRAPIRP